MSNLREIETYFGYVVAIAIAIVWTATVFSISSCEMSKHKMLESVANNSGDHGAMLYAFERCMERANNDTSEQTCLQIFSKYMETHEQDH